MEHEKPKLAEKTMKDLLVDFLYSVEEMRLDDARQGVEELVRRDGKEHALATILEIKHGLPDWQEAFYDGVVTDLLMVVATKNARIEYAYEHMTRGLLYLMSDEIRRVRAMEKFKKTLGVET